MSEKSFVTMEAAVCPVCAQKHQTGSLLLDKRLQKKFDRETVTGWQMCPEHQKMKDEGYIALVGIDEAKSDRERTLGGVWRIGMFAHLKEHAWSEIFNVPPPPKKLCFVDKDTLELLEKIPQEK